MLKVRLFSDLSEAASSIATPLPVTSALCLCLLFALAKPAYSQGLLVEPSSAVFGTVTAGTTSAAFRFTVTNNTTAPAVYDKKLGSPSFIVQPGTCRLDDSDTAVAAGATCVFTVQFAPTASGAEAGSLNFSTSLGPVTFSMSGTGLSASSGAIAIAPSAGDFGYVPVGETSPAISFTLTNHTTSTTEELGYTNFGEFSLQPGTCHLVSGELILNPGQSCVLAAVFKPTVAGPASATLSIHTSSGTFNLPLSGNGAALKIALPGAAFGGVAVGTTSPPLSLRVTNYTSAAAAYEEKRGSPSFQVQPGTCRMDDGDQMLAAGASCVFTVGFAPTEKGTATGSLVFSTNLGTVVFPMTGSTPVIYSYSVLHSFCSLANCADGGNGFEQLPHGPGLIHDAAGNLYGTTAYGGNGSCSAFGYGQGCGTVFKLDSTGHETVLYNFCSAANCADGEFPDAGLIQDAAGNLYGTTFFGGTLNSSCFYEGCGTVFKVDNTGHETILYSFCSVTECTAVAGDGYAPRSALIQDSAGDFYGTTTYGGGPGSCPFANNGCGTVFRVDRTGNETVLYSFCSVTACPNGAGDGYPPESGLIQDADGNLYGTTEYGGATNSGAVFKVDHTGNETVLYSFCSAANCEDGSEPYAGLIRDAAGNLYGTTTAGGANGGGTVFKLDSMGRETVLYNFCSVLDCAAGNSPYAGLIQDAAGYLYGTTLGDGIGGAGAAFSLDSTGHETVLHGFCSVAQCADGAFPAAGLVKDAAGNLYGTTSSGGAKGQGVVFKLTPQFN